MFTKTVNVPLFVPDVGDIPSQAPLVIVAVQFSVPPPELEILTVWLGETAPPTCPKNARVAGLSAIIGGCGGGGAGLRFNVTGIVTDERFGTVTRIVAV